MKVIKDFFCIEEKKSYKEGGDYNGKRKDLKGYINYPKARTKSKK